MNTPFIRFKTEPINLLDVMPTGLQLDVIKELPLNSVFDISTLGVEIRFTILDTLSYGGIIIEKTLPMWKREYYPELEETGMAGHRMSQEEVDERLNALDLPADEELFTILNNYNPSLSKLDFEIPIRYDFYEDEGYIYSDLHDTQFAPPNIIEILDLEILYEDKEFTSYDLLRMLNEKQKWYITDIPSPDTVYKSDIMQSLLKYFDNNGYEFYYFDLYKKSDPGLRSRIRSIPYFNNRGPRLLPTPENFEQASGGPNSNDDMYIGKNYLNINYDFGIISSPRYLQGMLSVLKWSKSLLVGTIKKIFGRIPQWSDLGTSNPRGNMKRLPGFSPSSDVDELMEGGNFVDVRLSKNIEYYMTLARIFLGAYDFWDWNDIKKRRYYRLDYLRWIANIIYLFKPSEFAGLNYDDLISLIKTRALPRRNMERPVTMPKTSNFFNL